MITAHGWTLWTKSKSGVVLPNVSGRNGIDKDEDFEEWYCDTWESLETLKPVRIVLVGLGASESAQRMTAWLATKGVEIDLPTFLGYRYANKMLVARRLEDRDQAHQLESARAGGTKRREAVRAERREALQRKADEFEMRGLWQDAVGVLERNSNSRYRKESAITFYKQRKRTLSTGRKTGALYKIEIADVGIIRIIFFPVAVDLCLDIFQELQEIIPFAWEPPPNATATERVHDQWFCRLNDNQWKEHRDSIAELVRRLDERWHDTTE